MAMLSQVITGKQPTPPRIMIVGTEGIGKSTFGVNAPKPIFVQTEDGLSEIDCAKLPLVTSFDELIQQLRAFCRRSTTTRRCASTRSIGRNVSCGIACVRTTV